MSQIVDPFRSYNFKLLKEGSSVLLGHFTRCSGIGVEVEAIDFREGGSTAVTRLAGPVRYADVTLEYGLTANAELWDWMTQVAAGRPKQEYQKNVSVVLLDADGTTERMRWDLEAAWPRSWKGAPLDASATQIAIETVTLVFDRLVRR